MPVVDIDVAIAQQRYDRSGMLAMAAPQECQRAKVFDLDGIASGDLILSIDEQVKPFAEQRPAVEPFPFLSEFGRDGELRVPTLEEADDFRRRTPQQLELEAGKVAA